MKFQDYYQVLGVARDADADAIKKAYRKLALEWHPDRHPEAERAAAEQRFKQISEAYEVLRDPDKRSKYDRFGENWEHGQEFTPPPGARTMSREDFERAFGGGGGFSDFFEGMFGQQFQQDMSGRGARHARYRHRGADVRATLELGISDAIAGGKRDFAVPARVACSRCGGVGFVGEHVCPTCGGTGALRQQKTVSLKIPDDLHDGQTLRLRGLGEAGEGGGEVGDLFLTFHLRGDETYRVLDPASGDVEADVPVAPWEALAGVKVEVRTPAAKAVAKIPADTRAGARLRLRGQGLAGATGTRGDFVLIVRLALPDDLSERQRELIAELGRSATDATVRGGARLGEVKP